MRVLLIGDLRERTRSHQRMRALLRLGVNVRAVSSQLGVGAIDLESESRSLSWVERLRRRFGPYPDPFDFNREVIEAANEAHFDLVWIEKTPVLRIETLQMVRRLQPEVRVAFFSEDDMTLASNRRGHLDMLLYACDVAFTTKSYNLRPDELPALGAKRCVFAHKSFDIGLHRPIPVSLQDRFRLGAELGFIGTFERQRAEELLFLAENGHTVRVWGNGWGGWKGRHSKLRVEAQPIYGIDYVRSVCTTDINLGFLRRASRDLHTDRSVEIPACGGFLLAERTTEHLRLFEEGREAAFFADRSELLAQVRYFLARPDVRKKMAAAGRRRVLLSDYSHERAWFNMLGQVWPDLAAELKLGLVSERAVGSAIQASDEFTAGLASPNSVEGASPQGLSALTSGTGQTVTPCA